MQTAALGSDCDGGVVVAPSPPRLPEQDDDKLGPGFMDNMNALDVRMVSFQQQELLVVGCMLYSIVRAFAASLPFPLPSPPPNSAWPICPSVNLAPEARAICQLCLRSKPPPWTAATFPLLWLLQTILLPRMIFLTKTPAERPQTT